MKTAIHMSLKIVLLTSVLAVVLAGTVLADSSNTPPESAAVTSSTVAASSSSALAQTSTLIDSSQARLYQFLRSMGAMLFVLGGLIAVSLYLKKRAFQFKGGKDRQIKTLERLSLDTKRSLVLIEVEQKKILLAVSPQSITAISEWAVAAPHADGADSAFQEVLKRSTGQESSIGV